MPFDPTTAQPIEFDASTAQEFNPDTAVPVDDEEQKSYSLKDSAKTVIDLAEKLPAMGGKLMQSTAIDIIDMALGIPGMIAKTLETGALAATGMPLKEVSEVMGEESAKPGYAASLAPLRTITDLAGKPLPKSPIGAGLEAAMGAVEKRGEEAAEATGIEAIKYATPMLLEGGMSLLAAHAVGKGQSRQKANAARVQQINEAKAAGLTTNEMAENILKKAAEKGINTEGITKPVIKATLDDLAEWSGTTVDITGKSAEVAVAEMAKLNKALAPFERRAIPRETPSLIAGKVKSGEAIGWVPQVTGVHYSHAPREVISGKFYGVGMKGAERTRLSQAEDPRIKQRVAFYVDEGQGVIPESGVGAYAHEVPLNNLYDAAKNPQKFPSEPNAFESAVLDAGFDGYYVRGAFDKQGAAVILGDAAKEIKVPKKLEQPSFNMEQRTQYVEQRSQQKIPRERAVAEADIIFSLPEGIRKATQQLIDRGNRGLPGGLIIDYRDALDSHWADRLTKFSGRTKEVELAWVQRQGLNLPGRELGGFYDPNTRTVFLNASAKRSAVDRLLHEISHATDNPKVNAEVMQRLADVNRTDEVYARTRRRMIEANQPNTPTEATAYLVSEMLNMGRQAGFSRLDTGFWQWATKALPMEAVEWLKQIVAKARATMYKYGAVLKESDLTPDDILALVKSNMSDLAKGKIEAASTQDRAKTTPTNKETSTEVSKIKLDAEKQLEDFKPENITSILGKDNWAILTAENPKGQQLTPKENTLHMNALKAELHAAGIQYKPVEGFYNGVKENLLLLLGVDKTQAYFIAKGKGQESVLVNDGLLYMDGTIAPATGIKQFKYGAKDVEKYGYGLSAIEPTGLTHIPSTGVTFAVNLDLKQRIPSKIKAIEEATFNSQREGQLIKAGQEDLNIINDTLIHANENIKETKGFVGPKKQRGAIGNVYVKTEAEAAQLASQPGVSGWRKTERGYQVQIPMTIEDAAKLPPNDVFNWRRSAIADTDFFKKQRGAVDTKLLITSGIVLGGATLGAMLVSDEDTTQGLLMGAALGFGGINLPKATRAISSNWKKAIKTTAVGATYATVGALVDKDNPVEGILVGSALFGTKFLPKAKVHPEDALIQARNGNIAAEKRLTAMTAQAMRDAIPDKLQREQLAVLMENPVFQGRTPQERLVVNAWRGLAKSYRDIAVNEDIKMGFIEGYVSHIIERGALPQSEVQKVMGELFGHGGAGVGGRAKFTKERMYPTFESLEKALEGTSLKLKTKDIADITQIYAETMNRTIENQRLINNLKDATLGDVNGVNARLLTTEAQPGYITLSNPQLRSYYIHPDIAPSLKFIFDSRNHAELTNGLVALNRATKRLNVLGSFFHAKSLLEAYALAGGNLFTVKGAIDSALKQFREGGLGDELDLGMRAGLRVELPTEVSQQALVQVGQLADLYVGRMLGKKVGVGEKVLGGLETMQEKTFDKFTWDYLHTGLKTATYLRLMEDYRLGKKGQGMDIDTFRQGAASHINDTFGGLDWYRVMSEAKTEAGRKVLQGLISPSGRDLLGIAIFAPDWTMSTVRAMTKALPGGSKNPANTQLARQYALRTAVLYASVLIPINYALSGHFPWDNKDPTRLDMGDGTNLQVVKHSMEFAEWVRDPWKTFSNKMGFFPRTFESLRYGKQYPYGPDIEGSRMSYVAQQIAPFTARSFQGHMEPEVSAARALLGMMGISVYGMTEEEKQHIKEERRFNRLMETPEMKEPKMR